MYPILLYRRIYLPRSETFIYAQLIKHEQIKPFVLTRNKPINTDLFPYEHLLVRKKWTNLPRIIQKRKMKLLHARFGPAGLELLPIAKKTGLPLLTSFHGSDVSKRPKVNHMYRKKLKKLFKEGTAFTVVSSHMRRKLMKLGCPRNKITIIRSGVDVTRFPFTSIPQVDEGKFRLLSVGRLVEKKGMQTIIKAFVRVVKQFPTATLTIIGEGEQLNKLEQLIARYHVAEHIRLVGAKSQEEVAAELRASHIFVNASQTAKNGDQEGIPNVLMEALAIGRPVIATRHAGTPELIKHGQNGLLVPEKSVSELTKQIMRMLSEQDKWNTFALNGRKIVEARHNITIQRKRLELLYLQLIEKNSSKEVKV
ncbi:glycosyltransferase [Brevibacillus daliensis]|uniref:glycosyltransferase n=1 Tax=Brevibacillus daliensis TaxID=2892995 RepID=UPI001E545D33|nr:glycosyltransferase [Brevibacillus daliensis]